MRAIDHRFVGLRAAAIAMVLLSAAPALAQETEDPGNGDKPQFKLSQEAAPGAKPWEKGALLSYTIDRAGPDFYNIQANAEIEIQVSASDSKTGPVTVMSLAPTASYKRSNASAAPTDALTMGMKGKYTLDSADGTRSLGVDVNLDYGREGVFPDRSKPPCDTNTTSVFCRKQYSETFKSSADLYVFGDAFEGTMGLSGEQSGKHRRGLSWSFSPRVQIAHDEILDGAVDPATGVKVTGGYTSIMGGAGLTLTPGFIDPWFEINLTGTVRQRIGKSAGRTDLTDRTEGRMQLSATYFITNPDAKGWRAGISVVWTEGGDSFADQKKESTIVFAFRIGRF